MANALRVLAHSYSRIVIDCAPYCRSSECGPCCQSTPDCVLYVVKSDATTVAMTR